MSFGVFVGKSRACSLSTVPRRAAISYFQPPRHHHCLLCMLWSRVMFRYSKRLSSIAPFLGDMRAFYVGWLSQCTVKFAHPFYTATIVSTSRCLSTSYTAAITSITIIQSGIVAAAAVSVAEPPPVASQLLPCLSLCIKKRQKRNG